MGRLTRNPPDQRVIGHANLTPRLRAQQKYYFIDPILAHLRPGGAPLAAIAPGRLSEQQTGLALVRNLSRSNPRLLGEYDEVLHYRSATGAEIDFVGPRFGEVAVESKFVDDRWGRELQTLNASPWRGVVASRGAFDIGTRHAVIPAPIVAVLLGG